jgi:hypothetical protein
MKIRMNSTAASLAAALLVSTAFPLAAADVIGKISYLEGTVQVLRDEGSLDAKIVKEGLALENFDLLKVGADGEVEVQITSPAAAPATLRVGPRTQCSIEIGKVGMKQQTTLDLITGSVAMKVARLGGSQAMRVQTEAAVVGVRGTDFTVTAPASGDLLVACDEGEVECTDEKGVVLRALAGEAIEQRWGKRIARLDVAAGALAQYRREWLDQRYAVLRSEPLTYVKLFAWLYDARRRQFNRQFVDVMRSARTGERTDPERLNWGALLRLKSTYRKLARLHAWLLELKAFCDEGGISGRIGLFRTSTSFFASLESRRAVLEWQMGRVRWATLQYIVRNAGTLPGSRSSD